MGPQTASGDDGPASGDDGAEATRPEMTATVLRALAREAVFPPYPLESP